MIWIACFIAGLLVGHCIGHVRGFRAGEGSVSRTWWEDELDEPPT
jgi:hypothetical protein